MISTKNTEINPVNFLDCRSKVLSRNKKFKLYSYTQILVVDQIFKIHP